MAYHYKGEYDRTITDFTKAIELDPSKPQIYLSRSAVYHQKGEYDFAIEDVTKALELNPNNAKLIYIEVWLTSAKASMTAPLRLYESDLNPNDANIYNHRGVAYYHKASMMTLKDFNTAIDDRIMLTPICGRGMAYGVKSDYDDAIQDYTNNRVMKHISDLFITRRSLPPERGV